MNENHRKLCPSPEWAAFLQEEVLPSLVEHADLGAEMLEIGPGPGASTDWLRHRVKRLVAHELDPEAATALTERFAGSNVEVVAGDATALEYEEGSFDSVGSFTMLHHMPTLAEQHRVLAEAWRVLRPGGVLIGSDSLASTDLHDFHAGDTYNPLDPAVLLALLRSTGFGRVTVVVDGTLRFVAHKPGGAQRDCGHEPA